MQKKILIIALFLGFINIGHAIAQEDKERPTHKTRIERSAGKEAFTKAIKLSRMGKLSDAVHHLDIAIKAFQVEKNWEGFSGASYYLTDICIDLNRLSDGINVGEYALKTIKEAAPSYLKKCHMIYHNMGIIYSSTRQFSTALTVFEKEVAILRNVYVIDTTYLLGMAYNSLAATHSDLGDMDAALNYFVKAKDTYLKSKDCGDCRKELGTSYSNLGNQYMMIGNVDKSLEYLEKGLALAVAVEGGNSIHLVQKYLNLGRFYYNLEETEQSTRYIKKAIFLIEDSTAPLPYFEAMLPDAYNKLGRNYLVMEALEEAYACFQKTLNLLEGEEDTQPIYISTLVRMGRFYMKKEDYDKAIHYLNQADSLNSILAEQPDAWQYTQPIKMDIFRQLGKIQEWKGDINQAITYYKKNLELPHSTLFAPQQNKVTLNYEIAGLYHKNENLDSALYYYQQAMIAIQKTAPVPNYSTTLLSESFNHQTISYLVLTQQALTLSKRAIQEKDRHQQKLFFDKAIAAIDLMDAFHTENLKKMNVLRANQSKTLIKHSIDGYRKGLAIISDYRLWGASDKILEKAFYYVQKMKAQQLWLTILKNDATNFGDLNKEVLQKERDLLSEMNHYENKIFEAQKSGDSVAVNLYKNKHLFQRQQAYQQLLQTMEANHPEYFELKYAFVPETVEGLQEVLDKNDVLVEYAFSCCAVMIFTLSKEDGLQMQVMPFDEAAMTERMQTFYKMLQKSAMIRKSSRARFINLSYDLYQQLIQPIENQLSNKERLIIIGDQMTNYIPFEVLLPSNEVHPFTDLNYLIKNHELVYHYSASLFAKNKKTPVNNNAGIYAFAPVYDQRKEESLFIKKTTKNSLHSDLRAFQADGHFSPLPESETEVKAILELFHRQSKASTNTIALRAEATEAALKNNLEKPYQFVHIAGHSFANLKQAKFSGIACFEENEKAKEDGILYTGEIYNIHTSVDLVTMSSCESGLGKLNLSEGLLGLNRAFMQAGAPNVVFSLWKVYDKVNASLMVDFYKKILEGQSYSASLRQAKLNLLQKEETAAPHYWSPYLLMGR